MVADDALHGTTQPPERIDIAHWVSEAYANLPTQFIINSWLHGPYTYFPPTVPTWPPNYVEPTKPTAPTEPTVNDSDDDSLVSFLQQQHNTYLSTWKTPHWPFFSLHLHCRQCLHCLHLSCSNQ